MAKAATAKKAVVAIDELKMGRLSVNLMGVSPLIVHRFATKAWRELLLPAKEKNAAERAASLKHDPLTEFREAMYINRSKDEPTLMHLPIGMFQKAIASAALDIPGAKKAQILRLVSISSTQVNLFGVPMLGMDMVRNSDMARTPDVRTRPYLPEWSVTLEIEYVSSLLQQQEIMNLINAAGIIVGIGDNRPQKGGSNGKFRVVYSDDKDLALVRKQARAAQEAAFRSPAFFNEEAAELYSWFVEEVARREKTLPSSKSDSVVLDQPKTLAAADAVAKRKRGGNGKARQVEA